MSDEPMRELTFNDFTRQSSGTAIYPGGRGSTESVNYCVLGLIGEAGELANKLKKVHRDNYGVLSEDTRKALIDELGDVLWYADRLAVELNSKLSIVANRNISKLALRKGRGTLKGSGDNR